MVGPRKNLPPEALQLKLQLMPQGALAAFRIVPRLKQSFCLCVLLSAGHWVWAALEEKA